MPWHNSFKTHVTHYSAMLFVVLKHISCTQDRVYYIRAQLSSNDHAILTNWNSY
jgi:hypothetical protein